jgi:putative membrane protein
MTWLLLADDASELINMKGLANAAVYTLFGVVVFALAFLALTRLMPFSIRKEIEEDQNTSLGIIIGSVIIGLAMIISAAVHG